MRFTNRGNQLAGMALVTVLTLGTGFASNIHTLPSADVAPQRQRGRNWDGYPNLGGSFDLRQTALNAGYNEGSKEGRRDHDKGQYKNYQDYKSYQQADKDYSSRLGDRSLYQRYYRLAFESGYDTENPSNNGRDRSNRDNDRDRSDRDQSDRGRSDRDQSDRDRSDHRGRNWDRYGTYGGSFQLRQTALNAGYNEGIKQGRTDGKKGRHRNYNDFSTYEKATQDYSSKLGDRELYRSYYREGFENGYEDGYRGY